ncbi:hypothetical protein LSAT2_031915 [Lamellibrachia satsuma]|nr:hypothetical protein LSAT2_031915 [Lamellibrachia satsuma]
MAAMLVSFLLLTAVVSRSHSASWPGIGPTSAPDTDPTSISGTVSKSTPDNGSKSTTHRRRDIVMTTTTRAHTTTTRAHTTTTRAHTTTKRQNNWWSHTTTTTPPNNWQWGERTTTSVLDWLNRRQAGTTTPWSNNWWDNKSTQTTPAINDRSNNYQGDPSTHEGVAPTTFLIFMSVPLVLLLYCYHKGKLKPIPSDTPSDQEVESPDDLEVESPVDLEIGPTQISEASSHSEDIPPPYESIVLAVDSLPSYYDALAMPSPNGSMPVPLPAPSVNGVVPRQLPSGPISTNLTTSGPVPTHLTN